MKKYVIALDQGTTSSRSVLIDQHGHAVASVRRPFEQIYPQPGWVEHNPNEILISQLGSLAELIAAQNLNAADIAGIGIANQRETTVVWDRATGEPIANAIVWQCRRTAALVEQICADPAVQARIIDTCGLVPDAYASASKIRWILDAVPNAQARAERGELAFGTIDSWLIWKLTGGVVHATDATNASRTMLYDIHKNQWDPWLLELFNIPAAMLPEVKESSEVFGTTTSSYPGVPEGIPICGVAGDQQAALFGQRCFSAGQAKSTYGTGCFLLMHTGSEARASQNRLITTIAASAPDVTHTEYALEGSAFVSGALIQWLRDELGLVSSAEETEFLAKSVPDSGGVYVVPALTGLGAPWWQPEARGMICGLTRGTTRAHVVRAALESLAYQLADLARAMESDAGMPIRTLAVDGGASRNEFLMQFQADILGTEIHRPKDIETTALGAAYLAGLTCGFWSSTRELESFAETDDVFEPHMDEGEREVAVASWQKAVRRAL